MRSEKSGLSHFLFIWNCFEAAWRFFRTFLDRKILFKGKDISVTLDESNPLGEGAYGLVYRATDRFTGSAPKYAVKKVFIQSLEFEQMVLNEINAFHKFRHRCILPMIDHMEQIEGSMKVAYILLPLKKRGSLRNWLQSVTDGEVIRPDLKNILKKFLDICAAFNVLHTAGYVHQDIKPENILIDDDGTPLLTDFGSVREANVEVCTRSKALKISEEAAQYCTASYRAPELFDTPTEISLDARTDVWGIGCLLFAWWFGFSPFECEFHSSGTRDRIVVVECTALRVLAEIPRPATPSPDDLLVLDMVGWILEKDITKRPFIKNLIAAVERNVSYIQSDLP
jgi:serine/threonine kinase 16